MEIQGVLKVKAKHGKGFLLEGETDWYSVNDNVVPYLAKLERGTNVVVTYNKKGVKKIVTKICMASGSYTAPTETTTEAPKQEEKKSYSSSYSQSTSSNKSFYGSAEDIKGKRKGCAVGAAANLLSNPTLDISDENAVKQAIQAVLYAAQKFEEYLEA